MKALIDVQIIRQEGRPMFAVLPYDQYLALAGQNDDSWVIDRENNMFLLFLESVFELNANLDVAR